MIVSTGELAVFAQDSLDLFNQVKRAFTVNKEPIRQIITNSNNYAGYNNDSNTTQEYNFIPVNATFSGVILYDRPYQPTQQANNTDLNVINNQSHVRIKVLRDARDYILNGKTESIIVDDLIYNEFTPPKAANYAGQMYYYFDLKGTY